MNAIPDSVRFTQYPACRRVLDESYMDLADDELESVIEALFPDATAEEVEGFFRSLQRFGKRALPVLAKAAPGAIQGAIQGGMVAGPYGALAGAGIGALTGILSSPTQRRRPAPQRRPRQPAPVRRARAVPPRPAQPIVAPPPIPPIPVRAQPIAPAATNPAAAQLLAMLSRPETMQALLAMLTANSGRNNIRVGARQVPVAAFANAISEYAAALVETAQAQSETNYLRDETGVDRCDVANPAARASTLFEDLMVAAQNNEAPPLHGIAR